MPVLTPERPGQFRCLRRRTPDDPMTLYNKVCHEIDAYFKRRKIPYLSGQRQALCKAVEEILAGHPGNVVAIPIPPGGGKSTMIRALLTVLSTAFYHDTAAAHTLGGVVVVVQKSSEGHELEELCNGVSGEKVALLLESANDFNLSQGRCPNGTASTFSECKKRACPDYDTCELMHLGDQIQDVPILILLHARYQMYLENMEPFLTWQHGAEERHRNLLLVDETPELFEANEISLRTLNNAESDLDEAQPSRGSEGLWNKRDLLFRWRAFVRTPFYKVKKLVCERAFQTGILLHSDFSEAGFDEKELTEFGQRIEKYVSGSKAGKVIQILRSAQRVVYSQDRTEKLCCPRLRTLGGPKSPATFIFSGTASIAPQIVRNPEFRIASTTWEESYQRLTFKIQRGDVFSVSKTAMQRKVNLDAAIVWLKESLPDLRQKHRKILVVSYKTLAARLWEALKEFQDCLIPYIDGNEQPQPMLPYFGGLNGSNLYQQATCVICLGLHRFEPAEYLWRAVALDHDGKLTDAIQQQAATSRGRLLEQMPQVMDVQDATLADDLIQLIFRCALRRHGETQPITVWLFQPPNGVLHYLSNFFPRASFQDVKTVPDACRTAMTTSRQYKGEATHAAVLLKWLTSQWDGKEITPKEIREHTNLTMKQFKEAKKNADIKTFFASCVETSGSGSNTIYRRKHDAP